MEIVFLKLNIYHFCRPGKHGMHSHHQMEDEYFVELVCMRRDNGLNTNQCNPNSNCQMIVGRLFPLALAHEMLTTTEKEHRDKQFFNFFSNTFIRICIHISRVILLMNFFLFIFYLFFQIM